MEIEPLNLLDQLGYNLTQLSLDQNSFKTSEQLVEAIQLELKYLILPEMAKGSNPTFEWSDGFINIFISIHVEGEDQFSYSIELINLK